MCERERESFFLRRRPKCLIVVTNLASLPLSPTCYALAGLTHPRTHLEAPASLYRRGQWTHMLDLAERSLTRGGWTFRRLDGSMSQQKRESALEVKKIDALFFSSVQVS